MTAVASRPELTALLHRGAGDRSAGTLDGAVSAATARLLWAAARPDPDTRAIDAAVDDGADIDRAAHAALANRVGPLYWRALRIAGVDHQLGSVAGLLKQEVKTRRAIAEVLLPLTLARIVDPLERAGLEPLIFKGPAVAVRYPEPGLRPMDDIDVLLPARQHRAGVEALRRDGWEETHHPRVAVARRSDIYDRMFVHHDVPQLPLELHWDVAAWHERATGVQALDLWRARRPARLLGVNVSCLPPDEDLVALANHAGKPFHHFGRLLWSVDLAVVISAAGDDLDWERVGWLARRWRCRTVLAVGLRQAQRLGAEVPDALLALPSAGRQRDAIAPVIDECWPLASPDAAVVYQLRYAFADSRARQAELLAGEVAFGAPVREMPARAVRLAARIARRWRRTRPTV